MITSVTVDRKWLTTIFCEGEQVHLDITRGLPRHSRLINVKTDKKDVIVFEFDCEEEPNMKEETKVEYQPTPTKKTRRKDR